jgi:hypothetical protein
MSKPVVVRINAEGQGEPEVQVEEAPGGYNLFTGTGIATAGIETGGIIALFGVGRARQVPDWGGRFVILEAPISHRSAVDIVWVTHDCDRFGNGDLQVGFNRRWTFRCA